MSSNFRVTRICKDCGNEFQAQKTTTQYCSLNCARRAYKKRIRDLKIEHSNKEVQELKTRPIEDIKAKEFLTVRDVSKLLNSSRQTIYNLIATGYLKAVNIKVKKTLIKRSEIDKLFQNPSTKPTIGLQPLPSKINETECYNLTEIQVKYGISDKALLDLIKRNAIPKFRKGRYSYVPKSEIDNIFSNKH